MAMLSIDDKLLGEKVENYCSSSEEEDQDENEEPLNQGPPTQLNDHNTGPKGVIEDWKMYKQDEYEKKIRENREKKEKINQMLHTFNPDLDEDKDLELDEEDDKFLQEYSRRRMLEIQSKLAVKSAAFGKVLELNSGNYVEEIENEDKLVSIIIHIYDENVSACIAMNGCLQILAENYEQVKFCKIDAKEAKLSLNFQNQALPAILVYKNNEVVGNFVRVSDVLGEDFYANDVEAFLISYSLLPTSSNKSL